MTGVRVSNQFWVIFHFSRPKPAKFTCQFSQITVPKLISRNFTWLPAKIVGIIAIFDPLIAKICESQHLKLQKFWFTALHSSVFEKVRELVGEIEYAIERLSGLGVSYIYSNTIFEIYRAFQSQCEIFIKFCSAIADILQDTGAQQCRYGNPKFRESLLPDDIAKSYLQHGAIVLI